MIQFLIVATVVFLITGYFFDVETAIKTGPKLMDYWMLAGLVIIIFGPVLAVIRLLYVLGRKVSILFRKRTTWTDKHA